MGKNGYLLIGDPSIYVQIGDLIGKRPYHLETILKKILNRYDSSLDIYLQKYIRDPSGHINIHSPIFMIQFETNFLCALCDKNINDIGSKEKSRILKARMKKDFPFLSDKELNDIILKMDHTLEPKNINIPSTNVYYYNSESYYSLSLEDKKKYK